MTAVPDKVLSWLYRVLTTEYHDVNRTYSDVAQTLSQYPTLQPRTEVYTYENGAPALLLQLTGTIPVPFRGTTYRYPLALWIPHAYPRESPIVYVTPAQGMLVRPGQHVSGEGRVYHPYLAQWGQYWDKSRLFDFLVVLRDVFAKEPPVRSIQEQPQPSKTIAQAPPPVPPPPEEWRRSAVRSAGINDVPNQQPPPKPPKPTNTLANQQPLSSQAPTSTSLQGPPLLPQKPTTYSAAYSSWPANGSQQLPGNTPHRQSNDSTIAFRHANPAFAQPQLRAQQHGQIRNQVVNPVSPISPEPHVQYPPPGYGQAAPSPQPRFQSAPYGPGVPQHAIASQHMFAQTSQYHQPSAYRTPQVTGPAQPHQPPPPPPDLLSSPLDVTISSQNNELAPVPAPPIPPNPQKDALLSALSTALRSQLAHAVDSNTSALVPLRAQNQALREAHGILQAELEQLQQLDAALASNEQILRGAMREADRVMEDARRRTVPAVDEVLVAPTVVGGQLYELCAEEVALKETLFVLAKALDRGRLNVDVFVKQTRNLAREQFLKRALIKKVAKGMGLEEFDHEQKWRRT